MLIAEIEAGGPDQEFYDSKVKVLSEQIQHHVHGEEKRSEGVFSQARAAGLDMDGLGARMLAVKSSPIATSIRRSEPAAPTTDIFSYPSTSRI